MKNFKTFGVMLDMSRNAVKTVDELKRFLPLLRKTAKAFESGITVK